MRTHIWIRKENEARWTEIKDKSSWINSMISSLDTRSPVKLAEAWAKDEPKAEANRKTLDNIRERSIQFCKHDAVKGLCKKGCK